MTRRFLVLGGLATVTLAGAYSLDLWRRFGALPSDPPNSPNCLNGTFHNLPDNYVYEGLAEETMPEGSMLKFLFSRGDNRYPPAPVRAQRTDLRQLADGEFVWLGHSSFLLKLDGKVICIDPVLSSRASPIPFTVPAWPGASPYKASDFPQIDYLLISHDHWDHLDFTAVRQLRYKQVLCGKGVGAHFHRWGLQKPTELDWNGAEKSGNLKFVYTPSRHFSGRGLTRDKSLWGGFVLDAGSGGKIYFTGDGGYGSHFADIGKKYGPFDLVFPDCGQYHRQWPTVHMFPEQSVAAARESRSNLACPCHFSRFTLAWHPWDEPPARFSKRATETGARFILPTIGEKRRIEA